MPAPGPVTAFPELLKAIAVEHQYLSQELARLQGELAQFQLNADDDNFGKKVSFAQEKNLGSSLGEELTNSRSRCFSDESGHAGSRASSEGHARGRAAQAKNIAFLEESWDNQASAETHLSSDTSLELSVESSSAPRRVHSTPHWVHLVNAASGGVEEEKPSPNMHQSSSEAFRPIGDEPVRIQTKSTVAFEYVKSKATAGSKNTKCSKSSKLKAQKTKEKILQSLRKPVGIDYKTVRTQLEQEMDVIYKSNAAVSFVQSEIFILVSALLTLSNSIYVGVQTNAQVQSDMDAMLRGTPPDDGNWKVGNTVFVAIFTIELLLRIIADRALFVFGKEGWWNFFDFMVVITSLIEVILEFSDSKMSTGFSLLRTFRAVRVVRLLRLQTDSRNALFSRFVRNLKTMLLSVGGTYISFLSAMLLLCGVMYIFGLLFMQGCLGYLQRDSVDLTTVDRLNSYYGTLDRTFWSLIAAVTGGIDWDELADPLKAIGNEYAIFFLIYVAFVLLGLLNILNSVFVQASLRAAEQSRELAVDNTIRKHRSLMRDLAIIFLEADSNKSGTISWVELQSYLQDERVAAYFLSLGLDISTIAKIFAVLDPLKGDEIEFSDFIEGCIRLRGGAKVVDTSLIQNDTNELRNSVEAMFALIHRIDNRLKVALRTREKKAHAQPGIPPPSHITKVMEEIVYKKFQAESLALSQNVVRQFADPSNEETSSKTASAESNSGGIFYPPPFSSASNFLPVDASSSERASPITTGKPLQKPPVLGVPWAAPLGPAIADLRKFPP